MKTCLGCKYADWKYTKGGKLHPSGDGLCTLEYKIPPLPNSRYFVGIELPSPLGGNISRNREYATHCPYYSP